MAAPPVSQRDAGLAAAKAARQASTGGGLSQRELGLAAAAKAQHASQGGVSQRDAGLAAAKGGGAAPAHHHGFFGNLVHGAEHIAGQTLTDLETMAVNSPAGLWNVSKAVAQAGMGNPQPLANIAVGMGKGFLQDFQHPLRHPGNTGLDIVGLLSLGAGTVARVAGAARAADAASAARILARGTAPEARNLEYGGMRVGAGSYSRNALRRQTQKLVDDLHHSFPELRLPMRTLPERVGHEIAKTRRFSEAVGRVPAGALVASGKKLSTPQMVALQVVMEGIPVADRITFHENQLWGLTGRAERATRKQIALLKSADRYIHDVGGQPALRPEFPEMQKVYDRIENVAVGREDIMQSLGKEPSDARVHEPGRLMTGGHYEPPTPGKQGIPSQALLRQRAQVDRLQALHDRATAAARKAGEKTLGPQDALIGNRVVGPGAERLSTSKAAVSQAQIELARLEKEHNAALDQIAGAHFGAIDRGEVNWRTRENARARKQQAPENRSGASGRKSRIRRTVTDERRAQAEQLAEDALAATPDSPTSRAWRARTDRIEQLRAQLNPMIGEGRAAGNVTAPGRVISPAGGARADRIGAALSVAKDRLAQMEAAAASRVKPTGIVGSDFTGQGLIRFPYQQRAALPSLGKVGGFKGGIPAEPGSFTHAFTGELLGTGLFRNDTTRLMAESYIEAHRFQALLQARDQFIAAAHDVKQSPHDIPIRLDELRNKPWPASVHELVRPAEEAPHLSSEEVQALGHAYEGLRQHLFPPEAVAEHIPGVKWIDQRLLGGLNRPNPLVGFGSHIAGKKVLSTFDAINNASRAAILYLKPAYAVPNLLGNLALTIVQQGFAAPRNLVRSARLNARLGHDAAAAIDTAMGEGFASAMRAEAGVGQRAINAMAGGWSKVVDLPFRRSAFFHEAARSGFKTDAQIKQLLKDPAELDRVIRRANDALIDYGNLGPIEREIVRRVIFFYPWVKGSTQYAGHFLGEHPQQAAVLGQLGQQGKAQSLADLGPVPSYAAGVFKVGERGGMPLVSNPAAASILGTPAQLVESLRELGAGNVKSAYSLSGNLTPAMQALNTLINGQTSMGPVKPGQSRLGAAAGELAGIPAKTLIDRLLHPPADAAHPRLYPMSRQDAILNFIFGGPAPRPMNPSKANQLAAAEEKPRRR